MINHFTFLKIAEILSKESKCVSKKVGAIFVKDNRIIASGINGSPSGSVNCNDVFNPLDFNRENHNRWQKNNECHAEMNAIIFAAKNGVKIDSDCILYSTLQPCCNCLKHIASLGIKTIYYINLYDKCDWNDETYHMLNQLSMKVKQLSIPR